jgi:hypothetical protein
VSGSTIAAVMILAGAALIYWALVGLGVLEEIPVEP